MINTELFVKNLKEKGINYFTGVPDSLLKDFCKYITDNSNSNNNNNNSNNDGGSNIICANEGNAIALASGYHLATRKIAAVYLQNSGLGNCVNPLTSLNDEKVYSIPILLIIGWRGEPGNKDEPQHVKMGEVTIPILETLAIPYSILPQEDNEAKQTLQRAINFMKENSSPYALVIQKGTFSSYSGLEADQEKHHLNREEAIKIITSTIEQNAVIVSTTGKTSRELFEYRVEQGYGHAQDFLTVGSMGHTSSIALGIALNQEKMVYCFDGDGSLLMHLGSIPIVGSLKPKNFTHIVLNNCAHDSVGGQPTVAGITNLVSIAKASNYVQTFSIDNEAELRSTLESIRNIDGPIFLEIKVKKGARKNLGRPTKSPIENKIAFMNFLND